MTNRRTNVIKMLAGTGIALLLLASVSWAGEHAEARRRARGLKAAGLKVYWSLLREDQKDEARAIVADFLVQTQPDRLQALARLVRLKADVSAALTEDQRRTAWAARGRFRALSDADRRAEIERMLDLTDRSALADCVASLEDATPADRVGIVVEILGQVGDVLEAEMTRTLSLSDTQRREIRALYDAALDEIRPIAVRLAKAKADTVERALGLLDDEQRGKAKLWHEDVRAKVLAFLRG